MVTFFKSVNWSYTHRYSKHSDLLNLIYNLGIKSLDLSLFKVVWKEFVSYKSNSYLNCLTEMHFSWLDQSHRVMNWKFLWGFCVLVQVIDCTNGGYIQLIHISCQGWSGLDCLFLRFLWRCWFKLDLLIQALIRRLK